MDTLMNHLSTMAFTTIYASPQCALRLYSAGFYLIVTPDGTTAISDIIYHRKQAERLYERQRRTRH
jgi:hypothetical protein